jgi:hypothetical protein
MSWREACHLLAELMPLQQFMEQWSAQHRALIAE